MPESVDALIDYWWSNLPVETKKQLSSAAESSHLSPAAARLLIESRCPLGPAGTSWNGSSELSWSWIDRVRRRIRLDDPVYQWWEGLSEENRRLVVEMHYRGAVPGGDAVIVEERTSAPSAAMESVADPERGSVFHWNKQIRDLISEW